MVQKVPRRARWAAPRRRRAAAPIGGVAAEVEQIHEPTATVQTPKLWHGTAGLQQIASLLWLPDYSELFSLEMHA